MESPYNDMLESYTKLASSLLDRWNTLASRAGAKMDSGAYDSASAMRDAADGASLVVEGGRLWTDWMLDAVAKCVGAEGEPNIAESAEFDAGLAGAKLELAGPLVKSAACDPLPASVATIEPCESETTFKLRADATGYRGGTYIGKVNATTDAGESSVITVWIPVP